ncbi:MAG: dihydroorotate dehydrogenase [Brevinema sp.]
MLKSIFIDKSLKNPLIAASGSFGFGKNYSDFFSPSLLGGIALKGLTLEPRFGNEGTRLAETPSGMLNSIGLQNPGLEIFEREIQPYLREDLGDTLTIANINGNTIEEYQALAERADEWQNIDMIELNISCPNVKQGGMAFGINSESAARVVRAVKSMIKTKPLIVKLSPNASDIASVAKAVEQEGAQAISLINTLLGMAIDISAKKPILGNVFGGLSGPAVKPIALRMVWQVKKSISIPILAGGGITSANDVIEFIMAGANICSIGTAFFKNPHVIQTILDDLEKFCHNQKINNISELIGVAHHAVL